MVYRPLGFVKCRAQIRTYLANLGGNWESSLLCYPKPYLVSRIGMWENRDLNFSK